MNESDLPPFPRGKCGEPFQRFGDEGMRYLGHRAPWNFTVVEEGPVQVRDIDAGDHVLDGAIPFLPLVDVGEPEKGAARAANDETVGVAVFVAMGNRDGSDGKPLVQLLHLAGFEPFDLNVTQLDQQIPGAVGLEPASSPQYSTRFRMASLMFATWGSVAFSSVGW